MSEKIQDARRVMRDAFAEDGPGPGTFRHAYQSNIAMIIYDRFLDYDLAMSPNDLLEECNDVADSIIKVAFEAGFEESESPNPCCVVDEESNGSKVETLPVGPSKEFIEGLLFETQESAQIHLNTHFPGYKISVDNDGVATIYDNTGDIVSQIVNEHSPTVKQSPHLSKKFILERYLGIKEDDAFEKARPDL